MPLRVTVKRTDGTDSVTFVLDATIQTDGEQRTIKVSWDEEYFVLGRDHKYNGGDAPTPDKSGYATWKVIHTKGNDDCLEVNLNGVFGCSGFGVVSVLDGDVVLKC